MASTYDKNDLVRLSCAFTVGGTATDPTTVTLKVKDPSGNTDTYTYALAQITKGTTGNYYKDVTVDEVGIWTYQYMGTGACQAVSEGWLEVRLNRV